MVRQLSISEELAHTTVRIECVLEDGSRPTGTGFFFRLRDNGTNHLPVIVTNKHVIRGAVQGQFLLTLATSEGDPILSEHHMFTLGGFEKAWFMHPDPDVDLCVMPLGPLLNLAQKEGKQFFYRSIDKSLLPTAEELDDMVLLEDIVMVGYPNGLWDQIHNMPVFRRGVTATHPNLDWNARPEFLIDAACFPGSSGSPVFLFNQGGFSTRTKGMMIGPSRVKLLGILYAGPQHTITGEIRVVTIPTQNVPLAVSSIPNNLGMVIKSEKLKDFEQMFGPPPNEGSKPNQPVQPTPDGAADR